MVGSRGMQKKLILILFFLSFIFSCAGSIDNIIVVNKPKAKLGNNEYEKLNLSLKKKNFEKYFLNSEEFIKSFYESEYTDDVLFSRAKIFMARGEYNKASEDFKLLYLAFPNSEFKDQAIYERAICLYRLNDALGSIDLLDKINVRKENPEFSKNILWMKANLLKEAGMLFKASKVFVQLFELSDDLEVKNSCFISFNSILSELSISELKNINADVSNTTIEPYILFEYAERLFNSSETAKSKEYFLDIISKYPEHEYALESKNYINKIENSVTVDPYTIGVILPLSGKNKAYGQKSLRGIQLAAEFFNSNTGSKLSDSPFKISIIDSESDPDISRLSVDKLISEDHVIAVIGALKADTAEAVATTCNINGVPNITLSHKEEITSIGDYIFSITMNNNNQIKKLVDYAYDQQNIKNFAILYPNDTYGKEYAQLFWDAVLLKGGSVTAIETYQTKQVDFRDEIQKLGALYYKGLRKSELNELKELKKAELGRELKFNEVELKPLIDFEAVFIPDDAKTVAQIAPYFAFFDITDLVYLGSNALNSPQLVKRGGAYVEGTTFVDDFFIQNNNPSSINFIQKFKTTFGVEPSVLEAQSYDATKVIIKAINNLISSGLEVNRKKLKDELLNTKDYSGATGSIVFDKDRKSEKSLFVLGVEKGKIIQKD